MRFLKPVERGVKRAFLGTFKHLLPKGGAPAAPLAADSLKRILLYPPQRLGDVIVSLPLVHELKKAAPALAIDMICSPLNAQVVQHDTNVADIFLYTKRPDPDLKTLRRIRRISYDLVVDMVWVDSVTSLFVTNLVAGKATRVGVGKKRDLAYYDILCPDLTESGEHIIDTALGVLNILGIPAMDVERHVPPVFSSGDRQKADSFVSGVAPDGEFCVAVNISAGKRSRCWALDNFAGCINGVMEMLPNAKLIVSAAPEEKDTAQNLADRCGTAVHTIPEDFSFMQTAAVIGRMGLLISPDTSLIHVARAFRVPVVGLYSAAEENLHRFHPYGQRESMVVSSNPFNIFSITISQVLDKTEQVIAVTKA
jgi:heptosyltransferase-3